MNYYSRHTPVKKSKKPIVILTLVVITLIASLSYWFLIRNDSSNQSVAETEQNTDTVEETSKLSYQQIDLQPTIDNWAKKYPSEYYIAVYDLQNGEIIGQSQPDEPVFAASLYKIYVAYLSLLDFQTGAQNPDEILIAGQTKRECIDKMIRSSDSPCGEAMMADIGQATLNKRVADIGMTDTIFNGIQTSAHDSALILKYIDEGRDLNKENTEFLLDAMLTQDAKFKRGLQTGAPEAKWQTKVGWNEDINYHDIGIMTLPDGRKFSVAILGKGSGSPDPIANFASTIYSALKL